MALLENIRRLSEQVRRRQPHIRGEESTKTSLILPFLEALGYDFHDPTEVLPEYVADFAKRRSSGPLEKVDYAIHLGARSCFSRMKMRSSGPRPAALKMTTLLLPPGRPCGTEEQLKRARSGGARSLMQKAEDDGLAAGRAIGYPFGHREIPMENLAMPGDLGPLGPLLERIVARLGPEEIWLFGSRAEGRARPDSDYDLLVVLPDGSPETHLDVISAWALVRGLDIPADIVPCTRAEFEEEKHEIDTLARAAFLRGRRIYER